MYASTVQSKCMNRSVCVVHHNGLYSLIRISYFLIPGTRWKKIRSAENRSPTKPRPTRPLQPAAPSNEGSRHGHVTCQAGPGPEVMDDRSEHHDKLFIYDIHECTIPACSTTGGGRLYLESINMQGESERGGTNSRSLSERS